MGLVGLAAKQPTTHFLLSWAYVATLPFLKLRRRDLGKRLTACK